MVGCPFYENCVRRFDGHNTSSDQLDDDVLGAKDCQGIAGNFGFFKCAIDCPSIVDRKGVSSIEGNSDR